MATKSHKQVLADSIQEHAKACDKQRKREVFTAQEYADVAQRLHHHLGALQALEQVWSEIYDEMPSRLAIAQAASR